MKIAVDEHTLLGLLRHRPQRYIALAAAFRLRHDETPQLLATLQRLAETGVIERRYSRNGDVYALIGR